MSNSITRRRRRSALVAPAAVAVAHQARLFRDRFYCYILGAMIEAITDIPFKLDTEALNGKLRVKPGSDHSEELADLIGKVQDVARPKAIYRESFIEARGEHTVTIDDVTFTSRAMRKNLDEVERVFPYIATCGEEVDGIEIPDGDFLNGFWLDAIKEALLRISTRYLSEVLEQKYKLGKTSTMSPGSGDAIVWPIEQQRELFSLFGDVENLIGVKLTDSFLMVPNKTVSGIRFPAEVDFQMCQLCHREDCIGRRAQFNKELWESLRYK